MHSLNLFIEFVQQHRYLGYTVLFVAMIFEGELFLTATGTLVRIHAFHFFDAFFFAIVGALLGDVLWYWAGRMLQEKQPDNRIAQFVVRRVKRHLPSVEKNPFHVIFISKFLYGLNHSTIFVLGFLKTEFPHFMKIQVLTTLVWSLIFLTVGYIFGSAAFAYTHRLDRFLMIIVGGLIFLALFEELFGWFVERANLRNNKKS